MAHRTKRVQINMLDGPIFSAMVRFVIPVLFSSIFWRNPYIRAGK